MKHHVPIHPRGIIEISNYTPLEKICLLEFEPCFPYSDGFKNE